MHCAEAPAESSIHHATPHRHWRGLSELSLSVPPPTTRAVLAAAADHFAAGRLPRLTKLSVTCPFDPPTAEAEAEAAAADPEVEGGGGGAAAGGRRSGGPSNNSLRLDALGRLTGLTSLTLQATVDAASEGWLPPSLQHLALSGERVQEPGAPAVDRGPQSTVGPAWMSEVASHGGALESLELRRLTVPELLLNSDPGRLHATLACVSRLMRRRLVLGGM